MWNPGTHKWLKANNEANDLLAGCNLLQSLAEAEISPGKQQYFISRKLCCTSLWGMKVTKRSDCTLWAGAEFSCCTGLQRWWEHFDPQASCHTCGGCSTVGVRGPSRGRWVGGCVRRRKIGVMIGSRIRNSGSHPRKKIEKWAYSTGHTPVWSESSSS